MYAATKTAVRVISEGLRQEVKPWNLHTTIVSPGAVATQLPSSVTEADVAMGIGQFYEQFAIPVHASVALSGGQHHSGVADKRSRADMNLFTAMFATIALLVSTSMEAQTMAITRGGSRPVRPGPTEHFTGSVRVEMLFEALEPSHASGGSVTFEPGARTAWHSHPRGQILIVTAGTGRVQRWGDAMEEIRTGDIVRIPAGQRHWHGASPHASNIGADAIRFTPSGLADLNASVSVIQIRGARLPDQVLVFSGVEAAPKQ